MPLSRSLHEGIQYLTSDQALSRAQETLDPRAYSLYAAAAVPIFLFSLYVLIQDFRKNGKELSKDQSL